MSSVSVFHEKSIAQTLLQYIGDREPELIPDNLIQDYFIDAPPFDENDQFIGITLGEVAHVLVWCTPDNEYRILVDCPEMTDEIEFEKKSDMIRFFRKLNLDEIILYSL